jgi:Tol biopolymer transport system component
MYTAGDMSANMNPHREQTVAFKRLFAAISAYLLLATVSISRCQAQQQAYQLLDDDLPGLTSKVFAPDRIALNSEFVGYGDFDPATGDFYYSITNDKWFPNRLYRISPNGKPEQLSLVSELWEGEPAFTPNGDLVMTAAKDPGEGKQWQTDLYQLRREDKSWQNPQPLSGLINSPASEWKASFSRNGNVYFSSERKEGTSSLHGDIHKAYWNNGQFEKVEELPPGINTKYNDSDPLIAPDESFLIFHSNRPGGHGEHDLYVSFATSTGWSTPQNLGADINRGGWEMAPVLTSDGKYLMYTWRQAMETTIPSQIRWVSMEAVYKLKPADN